jgi:NADH:ubiquinone oxidoreductase subunit F (NADH-binding)
MTHGRATVQAPLLLEALHALQDAHGHLSDAALGDLAAERGMPPARLHDFVSFFHAFTRAPVDPEVRRVCTGPACLLAGAAREAARPGARPVHCLGRCDAAPVVLGPGEPAPAPAPPDHPPDHWAWLASFATPEAAADLLDRLGQSGLTGMGGAGFPIHRKMGAVRDAEGGRRYVIANADEGEPGTFKDRHVLDRHPDEVLAGLLLACRMVGADTAYVYVRDEYRAETALLTATLDALVRAGLVADGDGTVERPRVHLVRGGGAYICGEESALIASLEDRRGEPRPGPPYPAERGLFGAPTLVQNVETLCYVARITQHGPDWFRGDGAGRRHYSVSGAVARPGVYERPADATARALLDDAGGPSQGAIRAFIPGGASSGLLPADALDVPLTPDGLDPWGTSPGTGGVVFVPEGACVVDLAARMMGFFAAESCGQCDPCRLGTRQLAAALTGLTRGQRPPQGRPAETAAAMRTLSICGLGRWAPLVYTSLERHFAAELEAHARGTCSAGTCPVGAS